MMTGSASIGLPINHDPDRMNRVRAFLESHSIATAIVGGQLMAYEDMVQYHADGSKTDCSSWIDVTNWPNRTIREWLGY